MKSAALILGLVAFVAFGSAQACPYSEGKQLMTMMDKYTDQNTTQDQSPAIDSKPLVVDLKKPQEESAN